MTNYFPSSYEDSRERFIQSLSLLQSKWPGVRLENHPLTNYPDLSINWIWADAPKRENLVIISTAEHGIEGYVGAAMMKIFIEEFAPRLNPENTGLLLICLGLTVVSYPRWLRWTAKLWLWVVLATVAFLGIAVAINYGPF